MSSMHLSLALTALAGFILSVVVHVSALAGVDISARIPYVCLLHAGMFVVFIPFVFSSRRSLGRKPSMAQLKAAVPAWAIPVGVALIVYAVVNFALFMVASEGGGPAIRNGHFVLESHGRFIRELTSTEYTAFKANELRGFSGHWLIFYYMPFIYFMFASKAARSREALPHFARAQFADSLRR